MQAQPTFRDEIESVTFPSIPHVLMHFLRAVEDSHASMSELAKLVGHDPALSARFMTVANSPALRRQKEIMGLEQCMVTLGTKLARTLAACLAIQSVFSRSSGETQYDFRGFWRHSLRVAELARALATRLGKVDAEEAYLSGLMHDVGVLLLIGSEGDRYGDLLRRSIDESMLSDIERPMIGTDHTAVAARLVDYWKLTSFMSDAVLFHHKSLEEIIDTDLLSRILWSSHVLSSYSDKLDLIQIDQTPDLGAVTLVLNLSLSEIAEIRSRSDEQVRKIAVALGVADTLDDKNLPFPANLFSSERQQSGSSDPVYSEMDDMVRNMALMQTLQQSLSSMCSAEELYLAIRESARILFGLGRVAFLLQTDGLPVISGVDFVGQPALLQRMEVRTDRLSSLAAAVYGGDRAYSTLDNDRPANVSLIDVQIAHALFSEGVLYVPLRTGGRSIGLMAYGISAAQHAQLQKKIRLMTTFAGLAATSIEGLSQLRVSERSIEENTENRLLLKTRKVVHEAGNPLSIIKNYLKIVAQRIPDQHEVQQELEIVREEIDRVSAILQRLSSLEQQAPVTKRIDLNAVIEAMLTLYSGSLFEPGGIAVSKQLSPELAPIAADQDSIKQIVLNLWKNASEALAPGGRVTIRTRGEIEKNGLTFVELVISDSGTGLPADVVQRLFQALPQGRKEGHSGLGLSIVANLVHNLGGFISYQDAPGQGATFTILFPCETVTP